MSREAHVRFWESAEVKSLRATQLRKCPLLSPLQRNGAEQTHRSRTSPNYLPSKWLRRTKSYSYWRR